ncbi:MAG TPA: Rab family GTPase [Thermoplasmata archaeon]|nr:Rab family GTPase [Thermoplasmata archaeon]
MGQKKKVVLLGDSAVGKTSLIKRFVLDAFEDSYVATVGSKVTKKELAIPRPDKTVNLTMMIWDLLGQEGYTSFHTWTFQGVYGAILVADLTRRETLDNLERYWIPALVRVADPVPLVFAANKADLSDRAFDLEDVEAIAAKHNAGLYGVLPSGLSTCYATSAKTGENVERAFESLGHFMLAGPPGDPVKELFESLVAMRAAVDADTSTAVGALDAVIVDFCEANQDEFDDKMAMILVRQEIQRAGVDVRKPTRDGVARFVEYLAQAEAEFRDAGAVTANRDRRLGWALGPRA